MSHALDGCPGAEDRAPTSTEGFRQACGEEDAFIRDPEVIEDAASVLSEGAQTVGVIDEQKTLPGEVGKQGGNRGQSLADRGETVGDERWPCAGTELGQDLTSCDVLMPSTGNHGKSGDDRGFLQARVGGGINEKVAGDVPQREHRRHGGHVAAGKKGGFGKPDESGERPLRLMVEGMVTGGGT